MVILNGGQFGNRRNQTSRHRKCRVFTCHFGRLPTDTIKVAIMSKTKADDAATHLLVVIDHQEARVYRTEVHGAVPVKVAPHDPHGFGRHLHSTHEWTDGKSPPERKSFYEAVAKTLQGLNNSPSSAAARARAVRWSSWCPT